MKTYKVTYRYSETASDTNVRYIDAKTKKAARDEVTKLLQDDFDIPPVIIEIEDITGRYQDQGFKSRNEYLDSLADNYGIEELPVYALADILGPEEDFDGLVTSIEDYMDMFI